MKEKINQKEVSFDSRATVKVKRELHEKMIEISKRNGNKIYDEYNNALRDYIQKHEEKELLKDSQLDEIMRKYYDKLDKHLSSMIAANGLKISTILAGLIRYFEAYFEVNGSVLYDQMRREGLDIFTNKDGSFIKNSKNIDE